MLKSLNKYMNLKFILDNKKDVASIAIFVLIVLLLFQFVYLPKARKVKSLSVEYKGIKKDVEELYAFIGGTENLKDSIIKMQKEMSLLEEIFPSEKEVSNIIKQLNKEAGRFKIGVVSVTPNDLEVYRDYQGKELRVSGYLCKCMPLTLAVEARYRHLGEFLMSLYANRTPMVTVEGVMIKKSRNTPQMVTADIHLTSYILGK